MLNITRGIPQITHFGLFGRCPSLKVCVCVCVCVLPGVLKKWTQESSAVFGGKNAINLTAECVEEKLIHPVLLKKCDSALWQKYKREA